MQARANARQAQATQGTPEGAVDVAALMAAAQQQLLRAQAAQAVLSGLALPPNLAAALPVVQNAQAELTHLIALAHMLKMSGATSPSAPAAFVPFQTAVAAPQNNPAPQNNLAALGSLAVMQAAAELFGIVPSALGPAQPSPWLGAAPARAPIARLVRPTSTWRNETPATSDEGRSTPPNAPNAEVLQPDSSMASAILELAKLKAGGKALHTLAPRVPPPPPPPPPPLPAHRAASTEASAETKNVAHGTVRYYTDLCNRELLSAAEAKAQYDVYKPGSSKKSRFRCDYPHRVPWESEPVGFCNLRYRTALSVHATGKCQAPGLNCRIGLNSKMVTPRKRRRLGTTKPAEDLHECAGAQAPPQHGEPEPENRKACA